MRTIIELPDSQVEALDALCRHEGISRAEAIRRAIGAHVKAERTRRGDPAFGLWRARHVSGLDYQRRARHEWDHR